MWRFFLFFFKKKASLLLNIDNTIFCISDFNYIILVLMSFRFNASFFSFSMSVRVVF